MNDNNSLIYYFVCGDQIRNQVNFIKTTISTTLKLLYLLAFTNDLKYQSKFEFKIILEISSLNSCYHKIYDEMITLI